MSKKHFGWAFVLFLALAASVQAQFNSLHSFAGQPSDGANPEGSLMLIGSTLYGMTYLGGGPSDLGTIFKINTNGTGFALLHSFAGATSDGKWPYASLIAKGSALYGMTYQGGSSDIGTIFKINTNGTGFELLHSFAGGTSDGYWPFGALIAKGSTLYGMTESGGTSDGGTIFKINTNGTGFDLLHSFAGGSSDGEWPYGSLILKGSKLFGLTSGGGANGDGTIFKISTNGAGFALLHSFASGPSNGMLPYGSLMVKGSKLYGMTYTGGLHYLGTLFKISTNGGGFAVLYSFAGIASDGAYPLGSLIAKGSMSYGMTNGGGASKYGVIFSFSLK